jgi:uncharacterized membrane protein
MPLTQRRHITRRLSEAQARALCYVLGPLSGTLFLQLRYGAVWSVRFHAFHAILMTASWASIWGILRLAEKLSPWFLSVVARELRFAVNLGFLVAWVIVSVAAYRGTRCAVIPWVHSLAVRLARKSERRRETGPAAV